jgi:hypothetical protein
MSNSKMLDSKYTMIDVLDEDKVLSGQKYVCMSFLSPEKILQQKETFYFKEFLNKWDFQTSMNKFNDFLNFMTMKYTGLDIEILQKDFKDFVSSEYKEIMNMNISNEYKTFVETYQEKLDKEFESSNKFQTSVRGLKVRGTFDSVEEAELRCKMIRNFDPNHDVFVGPVGIWIPWDPESYKTGRVEYMEDELNTLMHEKSKNDTAAKSEFESRVAENKRMAIQENMKNAKKTGNLLTQTIDEDDNLVGVMGEGLSTIEQDINKKKRVDNTIEDNVKSEIFNYSNIREIEKPKKD